MEKVLKQAKQCMKFDHSKTIKNLLCIPYEKGNTQ